MFDLDSDPALVAKALGSDPSIKRVLKNHQGIRMASGWDPYEIAITTILGQLVSVERGRALVKDLVTALGKPTGVERNGEPVFLFPKPEAIAAADLTFLKTTGIRKNTLKEFSRAVSTGEVLLDAGQDADEFTRKLLSLKGIGPWTANYMTLKILRHTDSFPATDLILARALEIHPPETLEKVRPWRGYAASLFWREYAEKLSQAKKPKPKR